MKKKKCDARRPWAYPADLEAMPAEDAVIRWATACRCGWHLEGLRTGEDARGATMDHLAGRGADMPRWMTGG